MPQDTSSISQFFSLFGYQCFLAVPLLTMRSIAEEKNRAHTPNTILGSDSKIRYCFK